MMTEYYTRDGKRLKVEMIRTAKALLYMFKRVAETTLKNKIWVSTVWLGLDHNFLNPGNPPLTFETCIFMPGGSSQIMERYSTEQQALEGHARICKRVSRRKVRTAKPKGR